MPMQSFRKVSKVDSPDSTNLPDSHFFHLTPLIQGLPASAENGADGVVRDSDEGDRAEGDLHRHRHPAAQGGLQAGGERGLQVASSHCGTILPILLRA